jgi:uncharacterized protein involved in exopolysaccharide biosynthesis
MENKSGYSELLSGLIHITRVLLKNIRWIAGVVLAVMILAAVIIFLTPNKYTSYASILPTGNQDNLSALRMLTGMGFGGLDISENSSALFPDIIISNRIQDSVLAKKYTFEHDGEEMTLSLKEYFDIGRPERLRSALGGITTIETDKKTGIIYLGIRTKYPELSQKVLQQILAELENYNLNVRSSQAKESERYLAREMKLRAAELEASEQSLLEFQEANQDWYVSTDPEILITLARLKRDIEINSTTYSLLREQYELARLNAQKDVPIVQVLDTPTLPTLKSSPRRVITILLAGMVAFILSFGFFIVADAFKKAGRDIGEDSLDNLSDDLARAFPVVNRLLIKRKKPVGS